MQNKISDKLTFRRRGITQKKAYNKLAFPTRKERKQTARTQSLERNSKAMYV